MTWEAAAGRLRAELEAEVEALRADLIRVEDHDHSDEQSKLIRRQIRDRLFEIDNLVPHQRLP